MSLSPLDGFNQLGGPEAAESKHAKVRRAAIEFEALLLTHFTAAINPQGEDEEDSLFSNSANEMYRQMFNEEVAKTLARSGEIGLADAVMRRLGADAGSRQASITSKAAEIARILRDGGTDSTREIRTGAPRGLQMNLKPRNGTAHNLNRSALSGQAEFQLPVEGRITSHFGTRPDPIHGALRRHSGVDISAPQGTPIQAAAAGTVIFAGRRGGFGNLVEIEHPDGRRTRYAHAAEILVAPGQEVAEGQTIATVGSTGRSTGPHLHFEVTENGTRVNPMDILAKDSPDSGR